MKNQTTTTDEFPISDEARRVYAEVVRCYLSKRNGVCSKCGGPMDLPGLPADVPCARCDYPEVNP